MTAYRVVTSAAELLPHPLTTSLVQPAIKAGPAQHHILE
jgi:hypothetical protein